MRIVYTTFTLANTTSVNCITINYSLETKTNSDFNENFRSHTLETIAYQFPGRSFANIYYYQQTATGRINIAETHVNNYTITAPWIEIPVYLTRFETSLTNLIVNINSNFNLTHTGTDLERA